MTYAELTALMQDFLENEETSFVANIPLLVGAAETRIYNEVRTPDQRTVTTGSLVGSTATVDTPAGFVEPLALDVTVSGTIYTLLPKSVNYIRQVYQGAEGTPEAYAVQRSTTSATTLLLGPTPASGYSYRLDYIGFPTSIVSAGTTWLGNNFEDVLLYACLLEGHAYDKGDPGMQKTYEDRYNQALATLRRSCEGLLYRDEYRDGPLTTGVQQ